MAWPVHTHCRIIPNATWVIFLVDLKGEESLVETMLTHLNKEDLVEVRPIPVFTQLTESGIITGKQ